MTGADPALPGAYALRSPEEAAALYRAWAATYDEGFVREAGYVYPQAVAAIFRDEGGTGPALDIGAGTGLIGAALPGPVLDGLDISAEMLARAGARRRYRHLLVADLTRPLPIADASYAGLLSAGTFTDGHVDAACLPELLRIARPGALLVLGIREAAFDRLGFGSAIARAEALGRVAPPRFRLARIYAEGGTHDHAGDTALVALLRRV